MRRPFLHRRHGASLAGQPGAVDHRRGIQEAKHRAVQVTLADAVTDHFNIAQHVGTFLQRRQSCHDCAGAEVKIANNVGIAGSVNQPHRHLLLIGIEAGQVGDLANLYERLALDFIRIAEIVEAGHGGSRLLSFPASGKRVGGEGSFLPSLSGREVGGEGGV
ncbi:hypothetical protein BN874_1230068 [Candidatus Contendobacter odensis Run_B_J11]|uniref:Uncharacterized protein n=1 Tax=Candidatus Contendobacter odensis Run_B_J11 TaxID=1400861 RepID=A0A7U7G8B4_9GAMM|nr:hypothetical protein BN874_1230068 [Candidatus Contendobacter odensis Run_B_J11]